MARAKKTQVAPRAVKVVPVKSARSLVTIDADSPAWELGAAVWGVPPGSIVRIFPPMAATDEDVERVRRACATEAAAVRVMPRRKAEIVTAPKSVPTSQKPREIVDALIEESNFEDRAALRAYCEPIMAQAGL
jgi:hypothetical protein